uniref:EamA domain-containing protein n=1 Tax=Globodera rostochiensis TaxID=31243 RepID=A0A914HR08_GLORO
MCVLDSDQNDFRSVRSRTPDRLRLFWGCLVVLCVAISTGYGSQLKFSLLNSATAHFYPPFLMMWFNNCCLIICFPLYLIFERIKSKERSVREITAECAQIIAENGLRSGLGRELFFLLLYTIGNYSYALSLGRITSSAALTVRSFDVSLVYLLGHLILSERFITLKTMAVALATGGVLLIAQDHQFAADLVGVFLVLLSCGVDAIYKVSFKWMAGQASFGQGMFFLSGMALVNLPINALPTALLLHFGVERWEWAFVPWSSVIGFVLLTFVFNISTIFGVALLNPLIISIGVLCGIPISIGIDVAFRGKQPTVGFLIGAILLVASTNSLLEKIRRRRGGRGRE